MNEIYLLYCCDQWHSWQSHRLLGVFSNRKKLNSYLTKMQKAEKIAVEDLRNLAEINQTQGLETNFNILVEKLNPQYEN